jgi:prepilin-type N-terminal cleavage/methylation domain-containing protein
MRSNAGYTLIEVVVVVGLIGVVTATAVPVFLESGARNRLWTGSEQIGAAVRQARLKAISTNTNYRVVFDCPSSNELRTLVMTGDTTIDDAEDRCSQTREGDTGTIELPTGVAFDHGAATSLEVNSRGIFAAHGAAIPLTITVTHGSTSRTVDVSATGQISFGNVE